MRVRPSYLWYLLALAAIWIGGRWAYDSWQSPVTPEPPVLVEGDYAVNRVVDGDTIILQRDDGEPKVVVRLIGIDTPETVHPEKPVEKWGPEASAFTKKFLVDGKCHVRLDRRRADRYGRRLAYVYVGDKLLNAELLREGLARLAILTGDTLSLERQLRQAEAAARSASRGKWSDPIVEKPSEEERPREAE